jgi:hypothetical protein
LGTQERERAAARAVEEAKRAEADGRRDPGLRLLLESVQDFADV